MPPMAVAAAALLPAAGLLRPRLGFPASYSTIPKLRLVFSAHAAAIGSEVGAVVDVGHKLRMLKDKMATLEINTNDSCQPGQFSHLLCPKCKGGKTMETCLSFHIIQDGDFAMWRCFRPSCGWAGQAFVDHRETIDGMNLIIKVESSTKLTIEELGLEPLGNKLISFFKERNISKETLQRNAVMQTSQGAIAFTYRENGLIVGCKYRTLEKRFWLVGKETGTEKWLYGVDDINEATELIIVEGEIDKISFEEAGFRNCVSVPTGAPVAASSKGLPSQRKVCITTIQDRAFKFVWNCKEYLDKVPRIILATDGDSSGQALAEELARRLGKERCWIVRWPRKDDSTFCKDANEVLVCLGPRALTEAIESAELYGSDIKDPEVEESPPATEEF
ncbi:Primase homolog protein [Linum grandiflorum]